jgi:hypothetical protein
VLHCRNALRSETDRGELIAQVYADIDVTDLQALIDRDRPAQRSAGKCTFSGLSLCGRKYFLIRQLPYLRSPPRRLHSKIFRFSSGRFRAAFRID